MPPVRQSKNEQMRNQLLEDVSNLKREADVKQQEIASLQVMIDQFEAQYQIWARSIRRQRQALERSIQLIRLQIERETRTDVQAFEEPSAEVEDEEILDPPQNVPPTGSFQRGGFQFDEGSVQRDKMTAARNFFAKSYHIDAGNKTNPELMVQLNKAFGESIDLTDLLIAVPWDGVWQKPGYNESIGEQIGRLGDWYDALIEANNRLEGCRSALLQHEFYQALQEKQAAEARGDDYFTQLGRRENDEITRLEQVFSTLRAQLQML